MVVSYVSVCIFLMNSDVEYFLYHFTIYILFLEKCIPISYLFLNQIVWLLTIECFECLYTPDLILLLQ
jgi:hypothetical protein